MRSLIEKFLIFNVIFAFSLSLFGCSKLEKQFGEALEKDFGEALEKAFREEREKIIEELTAPEEKIFRDMYSSNGNQSPMSRMDEELKQILLPVRDLHIRFTVDYILFAYPTGSMPEDIEPGTIFSNMEISNIYFGDIKRGKASDSDFPQWLSMGRSEKHSIQKLQAHIISIFSFSSPHQRNGEEQILKFEVVFEFECGKWEQREFKKKLF